MTNSTRPSSSSGWQEKIAALWESVIVATVWPLLKEAGAALRYLAKTASHHLWEGVRLASHHTPRATAWWEKQRLASYVNGGTVMGLFCLAIIASTTLLPTSPTTSAMAVTSVQSESATRQDSTLGAAVYQTGNLAGRNAADLYASYMGYSGTKIPQSLEVDWDRQLERLWERKTNRDGVTPVAVETRDELVAEYRRKDQGRMDIESYQVLAAEQATAICANLDWDKVRKDYKLNERKGALLQRVSCNMGGRVLLAYAMTELLPSDDGELNRNYLDFLLRHGGRRYVESLPAVHDDITSFGPFQFTQFAVYDTPKERRGASKVNAALPRELKIPGSTAYLRGNDHLRAGYLFAIANLADGIRSLNSRQLAVFEEVAGPQGVAVAQYIAVAHNKPAPSRGALRSWLSAGGKGSFAAHCSNRASRLYAQKTRNNYEALSPTRT